MHSVLQKQIHGDLVKSWTMDLHHAQFCLAILERCGLAHSTTSRMQNQLANLLRCVANFTPFGPSVLLPQDYPLTIPEAGVGEEISERMRLSVKLLVRLCGPFNNLDNYGMQVAYGSPT
ncbi:hypothetical protein PG993_010800 [Apiospora rasikravindrae]|uniref:Uncharacterized protein n=1 Tax=Apiospora rasikravindrae TaxID=990691 RepID=A0ABR1SCF0_9PEZI